MRGDPMGDAPFNPPLINEPLPLPLPGTTTAKGDQILGLMSAGWTNEKHSTYLSAMEACFVDQLYGLRKHGHVASDHEGGGQPASTWVRRFRPHNAALHVHHRADVTTEASLDDYGSGTDSVGKVHTHGRDAKASCAQDNFIEVSDQNFSEEDVEADDEPCKRRRPSSTSSEPNDQPT